MMHRMLATSAVVCVLMLAAGCRTATGAGGSTVVAGGTGTTATAGNGGVVKPGSVPYTVPLSSQTTTATITDPSLNNIVAATLTIPAGWKLDGIEMMSPCTFQPWPVFRAYSPDGLMQYRIEPVIGWRWRPALRATSNGGCANISGQISAANFLEYYMGTIQGGVHVVGTMPVPAQYQQWAQNLAAQGNKNAAGAALHSQFTADTAALRIEVVNGTFVVEERLRAAVECSLQTNDGAMNGGTCWARVDELTAPLGKLDPLVQLVDSDNLPHGVNTQQWVQAAMARQQKQDAAALAALTAQESQESQALYQQFQQTMQRMQQEHQQFMQQQESQFESAMNAAYSSMNAQTTSASDWVDYALDQQTVMGPNGTPMKVQTGSQVWTNGSQWYQTTDPNANPNGVLGGTWTKAPLTHGNGEPM